MSLDPTLLAFAVVVLGGYLVQTASGFGSTLVCVTFGAHLLPIRLLVPLVLPLSVVQNTYIVIRHRDGVRWRLLLTRILPLMGGGMLAGFLFTVMVYGDSQPSRESSLDTWLRSGFAVLVLVLAARELFVAWRVRTGDPKKVARPASPMSSFLAMIGAGLVHGVYATGGPLLVYAVGREGLPKREFRSTLSAVWLVLDSALMTGFVLDGRYDASSLWKVAILLPSLPLGIVVGERIHRRIPEAHFKTGVFALLVVAAIMLLVH